MTCDDCGQITRSTVQFGKFAVCPSCRGRRERAAILIRESDRQRPSRPPSFTPSTHKASGRVMAGEAVLAELLSRADLPDGHELLDEELDW